MAVTADVPGTAGQSGVSPRRRAIVLATCCSSLVMASMDATIVNVALPSIARSLHASGAGLQWVVDGYLLVLGSLLLSAGALGDRFGRRRMFEIGLVVFMLGSLACSLAPGLGWLVAFRMLQAVGGSVLSPATLSIIASVYRDPRERAHAIGVWNSASGASLALGPVLGGVLVASLGWRSVFWVNLPIGLTAALLARRYVPESRAVPPRALDWPGQILAIACLASLTSAIIEAPEFGWGDRLVVALFGISLVFGACFVAVERRRPEPLLDLALARNRRFSAACAIVFCAYVGLTGFTFVNTLYLQGTRGFSPLRAGLAVLPAMLLIMAFSPVSGRIVGKRGPRAPLVTASVLLAVGLGLLGALTPQTPIVLLLADYALIGCAIGLVNPPVSNIGVSSLPVGRAGVASATQSTARQLGSVFGVALVGSIVFTRLSALSGGGHESRAVLMTALTTTGAVAHGAVAQAFAAALHPGYFTASALNLLAVVIGLAVFGSRKTRSSGGRR